MDYLQSGTDMGKNTVPFPLTKSVDFQPAAAALFQGVNTNISPLHCRYHRMPSVHPLSQIK